MKFESSFAIMNSNSTEIVLHLDPWGDKFLMPAATRLYSFKILKRLFG